MAGALEPISRREVVAPVRRLDRRTTYGLDSISHRTLLREAQTRADGIVAQAKIQELGHTTREGLTEIAFLHNWSTTLANGDPLLFDRLSGLVNLLTVTVSEVVADLNDVYCREARS